MLLDLRKENREQYIQAMEMYMNYAFDGEEPDLTDEPLVMKMFWTAAKPLIDANNKNYINGCKGGAPAGNKNAKKSTENNPKQPKTTQKQPRVNSKTTQKQGNDNVNDNVNANANVHDNAHVNDNVNDNVNVNIGRNPYVDINTMEITDFDKYDEWNEAHGIVED